MYIFISRLFIFIRQWRQVTRLTMRQAVKTPLAENLRVTCGGYSIQHKGMGAGSMYVSSQYGVSPSRWLGSLFQLGHQPKLGISCGSSNRIVGRSVQVGGLDSDGDGVYAGIRGEAIVEAGWMGTVGAGRLWCLVVSWALV